MMHVAQNYILAIQKCFKPLLDAYLAFLRREYYCRIHQK